MTTTVLAPRRTSLVGRDDELDALEAALDRAPMVTLSGVGGVGKSSLAAEVARRIANRDVPVFAVDLTTATGDDAVVRMVADGVGLPAAEDIAPEDALVARLCGEGPSFLLMDNCDLVLDGVAALADTLLARCPDLKIVATSREPVGVDGEQVWPVHPLRTAAADGGESPAVQLLVDRIVAANPSWNARQHEAGLRELAERLDGVPLALELAAARLTLVQPAELVEHLEEQLATLASSRRVGVERHRSLTAVVEWSVGLLAPDARRLLAHLAVFSGGFTRQAVLEVVGPDEAMHLDRLVEASLVAVVDGPVGRRFRMLTMIRAFAEDELRRLEDCDDVGRRHAEWAARWVTDMRRRMQGPDELSLLDVLDVELPNLGAAIRWTSHHGEVELCVRVASGLEDHLFARAGREVQAWISAAAAELAGRDGAGDLALIDGLASINRGDLAGAIAAYEVAKAANAPAEHLMFNLDALGSMEPMFMGRFEESIAAMDRWRESVAGTGAFPEAIATMEASLPRAYAGWTDEAVAMAEESTRLARQVGSPTLLAWCAFARGEALIGVDPAAALEGYREADELATETRSTFLLAVNSLARASALARYGAPGEAFEHFDQAIERFSSQGAWAYLSTTMRNLSELLARVERYADATVIRAAVEHLAGATVAGGADAERDMYLKALLKDRLLAARYDELVEEGRRASRDEVTERARAVVRAELDRRRSMVDLRAVLFTDLEDSTSFTASRGDRRARDVTRRYERLSRELLAAHRGRRIKSTGDGMLATFPSVSDALLFTRALLQRVDDGVRDGELPLRLRVGLHAGEMIAETDLAEGHDIHGTVVNLTARVLNTADGGEAVVTDTVRQIVAGGGFEFRSMGEFQLKGIPEPVRLYRFEWREPSEG